MTNKKPTTERKLFFTHISEYESLHRYDHKPYVKKLMTLYQIVVKAANDREQWVNEARQDAAKAHAEIEAFKSSVWYKLYRFFA